MSIRAGYTAISSVVPVETRDRLKYAAEASGLSVSAMLAEWLESGIDAPLDRAGKMQSVRKVKDELMVSLPMAWVRSSGTLKGDRISVSYSHDAVIIRLTDVSR